MSEPAALTQSPFTILTFIVAPALLTNASSVLALSTTNRMLRTRELMRELVQQSAQPALTDGDREQMARQGNRIEAQAGLLLLALHAIYVALGSFAGATLLTLIGAVLEPSGFAGPARVFALLGLTLGATGVGCLILGSIRLFRATQLSLMNIRDEADLVRRRAAELRESLRGAAPHIDGEGCI